MQNIDYDALMSAALETREYSYSPYSGFAVGAALLCVDGSIFTGCNIENAAFTPTVCAERVAIFKAVAQGKTQKSDFAAIAIAGARHGEAPSEYCAPCGVCRQVLAEFCDLQRFQVVLGTSPDDYSVYTLEDLLPMAFTGKSFTAPKRPV